MKYKVIIVCYLREDGAQIQKAFISRANSDVRISDNDRDSTIKMPLITVEFFKTKDEAVKNAKLFCRQEDIFQS